MLLVLPVMNQVWLGAKVGIRLGKEQLGHSAMKPGPRL